MVQRLNIRRAASVAGRLIASVCSNRRGGVTVPFALALAPLTMLSVAAVDFNRGVTARAELQDALDAAALSVGRSNATDPAAVQQLGVAALSANLRLPADTTLLADRTEFNLVGTEIHARARAQVKPLITSMFTGEKLNVAVVTHVRRGGEKLEIALVLDNTGSMSGSKLSLLKTAANNFVDTMAQASAQAIDTDTVKISLVPFSATVNVGSTYTNGTWLDQNGASPINDEIFTKASGTQHANRLSLFASMHQTWGGCVESRKMPYDIQDTAPTTATPATLFTPYFAPDESSASSSFKNDYMDNDGNTDRSWKVRQGAINKYGHSIDHTGATGMGYKFGPNSGCELAPVVRLTKDFASLKTAINGMAAVGDTNIPMGLVWGWHTLSPQAPFADGVAYGQAHRKKIVILMTDGQNANAVANNSNSSYYSGIGYIWQNRIGISGGTAGQRQTALDSRLTALCNNMKAPGKDIIIYTVRVEVNDSNYGVLRDCASQPGNFYDVASASDLNNVFQAIAASIQNLRLAK
jgi:Flp pilus assembly protein TadG